MGLELYTQPSFFANGLSATTFYTSSAIINVADITLYELSGFNVIGDLSVSNTISSNTGIFEDLTANSANIPTITNSSITSNVVSAQDSTFGSLLVTSMTAQTASFQKFLGRVEIDQLLQTNALTGQTIIYTKDGWRPSDFPNRFPGTRLHDFQLTSYDANFQTITADTSYCGVAPSGSLISSPVWRIYRLKYNDAGFVYEQGITVSVAWSARYTATYLLF